MDYSNSLDLVHNNNGHDDVVHSSGLRGYVEVMQQLGIDAMPLLAKHGIKQVQLQDDNEWILIMLLFNY